MYEHHGGCHCRNLRWTLRSEFSALQLPARACQCDFCRKHGALTTSDSAGEMCFVVQDPEAVTRYSFATKTADFLICGRCGVYVGARTADGGKCYAIANLRTLDGHDGSAYTPEPMDYSSESSSVRRARRALRWTPVGIRACVGETRAAIPIGRRLV